MGNFSDQVGKFNKKTMKNTSDVLRLGAIQLFSNVINPTPVDTGRARANWQLGIGEIPKGILPAPGSPGDDANGEKRLQPLLTANIKGKAIYLTNNLPYIRKLEYGPGRSNQAPVGWVRIAVLNARAMFDQIAREISKK